MKPPSAMLITNKNRAKSSVMHISEQQHYKFLTSFRRFISKFSLDSITYRDTEESLRNWFAGKMELNPNRIFRSGGEGG